MDYCIVMSDLHLGEEENQSTLADINTMNKLVAELKNLGGTIKQLVLAGDILDLALAPLPKVTEQMEAFFKRIHETAEEIIYLPGNHDHHIWTLHVEQDLIKGMQMGNVFKQKPEYIRRSFKGASGTFVSGYLPDDAKEKLTVKYPTHEYVTPGGKRCFIHHGHQIYGIGVRLLSLKEALSSEVSELGRMEELELQNIGVYELLWYYLEASEIMRTKIEEQWDKHGGHGAFSLVAKEIADKKYATAILSILPMFRIKPTDRDTTIADVKQDISNYLKVCDVQPDCLIYGHSHTPELKSKKELKDPKLPSIIGNCGSWLSEREDREFNTYIILNDKGVELRKLGGNVIKAINWS